MSRKQFLHERSDLPQLYSVIAGVLGATPQVVEKDYWLMHCLWGLKHQGLQFELKGGTSLSKGYGAISRFSEDIDIYIHPPPEMEVKVGKNQDKPAHIESRRKFFEWLAGTIQIPGILEVERDRSFDDEKLRNAGLRLHYRSIYEALPGLKSGVLLEVGFDVTTPNEPRSITSWAYERAIQAGLDVIDNRAVDVLCYLPEYTFVEKLQTISTKYRQEKEQKILPINFIRHYYDLYQLLLLERVQKFIGSGPYHDHKEARFRPQDEKDLTKNEAFVLSDAETRLRYNEEYQRTAAIYYREQPSFDAILSKIGEFRARL